MALELINDTIKFNKLIGEGQNQLLVDRDIIVPDIKPDILKILSVDGNINAISADTDNQKIIISGKLHLSILYSIEEESQAVYSMEHVESFSHYIDVKDAKPKMESKVKCSIEHINFNKINSRKINYQCVISMEGKVSENNLEEVVKEVIGMDDIQMLKDTITTDDVICKNSTQAIATCTINIPLNFSPPDEIIQTRAILHKKAIAFEEGAIVVSGNLFVPVLILAKGEKSEIYRVSEDMFFSNTIEMTGIMPDMECDVVYSIDDIYSELREDENGEKRQIYVEVVVGLKAEAIQKVDYPVIIDAYSLSKNIELEEGNVNMDMFIGKNYAPTMIRETIKIPDNLPGIENIYDMLCKIQLADCKITDEKAIIEGVSTCNMLYLTKGENLRVESYSEEIPLKCYITIPGYKDSMKLVNYVDIDSIEYNIVSRNEVEIKIMLDCSVKVYDKYYKKFIKKVIEKEDNITIHKSSITIYMVQPNDTLWKIAKRYHTTVEDILKVNDIEDKDKIMVGMKIVIPKK